MMRDTTLSAPPARATSLVVIGASAGGVEALRDLVRELPATLGAAVLVVLHVPASGTSALPAILNRSGPLPARHAVDGDLLVAGQVLVAPPDHHLLVLDGRVSLTRGPQENGHRPAVDVLFRSAARAWDGRVTAVVLSGTLDDGAAGMLAVSRQGGHCLAQDPDEALYGGMPRAAAAVVTCEVHDVRRLAARIGVISAEVAARVSSGATPPQPVPEPDLLETETLMAEMDPGAMHDHGRPGHPSGYGCPDCAGSLFAIDDGPLRRYRCRVGHAWSPDSLVERQTVALESALWMALRSLEEKAALNAELAGRAQERGSARTAERFEQASQEATDAAELVRELVATLDRRLPTRADGATADEVSQA